MVDVQVRDNPSANRYEARIDGELAGYAAYEVYDDLIVFTHTLVEDGYEGNGVGSALARAALDDVRDEDSRRVVPKCSFIKSWIDKHPDYRDLLD